jgi:hypothetical protein
MNCSSTSPAISGTVKPVDPFLPSMEKVVWVLKVLVLTDGTGR